MIPHSFKVLRIWTNGELIQGAQFHRVQRFSTDSRTLQKDDAFVALMAERDGHDFIPMALERGAKGLIVSKSLDQLPPIPENIPVLKVPDTLKAFQAIAREYRKTLQIQVIGITGSNGKTSCKDFVAGVLSQDFCVLKTEGNLNNHIGVPQTILRADRKHEVAIIEMGTNHPGEIKVLAEIAQPNIGIITNIGTAHIEYLKSRDGIAEEKGALLKVLPKNGLAVLDADSDYYEKLSALTQSRIIGVGFKDGTIHAKNIQPNLEGSEFTICYETTCNEAFVPIPGKHMILNAMYAVAVGVELGISFQKAIFGLAQVQSAGRRLQYREVGGIKFLDDCYNANRESMIAALDTLKSVKVKGSRIAVLGPMGEQGEQSEAMHKEVGEAVGRYQIDRLVVVGEAALPMIDGARKSGCNDVEYFATIEEAVKNLKQTITFDDLILIKASRPQKFERIMDAFGK
jgi:UDP-N-acetylmuramoyl-tripeptide--D-alanyl-D-alanine ligase